MDVRLDEGSLRRGIDVFERSVHRNGEFSCHGCGSSGVQIDWASSWGERGGRG